MSDSYIIFECFGGIEKDLIATAVVANIAKAHPERKIVVVSLFPEIWLHNPNVFRVYKGGATPYFFDDYIKDKDTIIFKNDPYNDTLFTKQFSSNKKEHIIKIWSDMLGVHCKQKIPEMFFTQRELEVTMRLTYRNKPLFFLDTGFTGNNPVMTIARNIPIEASVEIAKRMLEKGYHVFQLGDETIPNIPGTERLNLSLRLSMAAITHSNARFFTHSFLQHITPIFKKPSVVVWVANSPEMYGYDINQNIKLNVNHEVQKFIDSFSEFYEPLTPAKDIIKVTTKTFDINNAVSAIISTSS